MTKQKSWTVFGNYNKAVKPNLMAQVFAVVIALATFQNPDESYPWLMSVLVILGSLWVGYWAWKGKSILGLATPLVSLLFLDPLLGGSLFHNYLWFMVIQGLSAMLFAVAGYTFMRVGSSQSRVQK